MGQGAHDRQSISSALFYMQNAYVRTRRFRRHLAHSRDDLT